MTTDGGNSSSSHDQRTRLVAHARAEHDDLLEAIHRLEAALGAAAPGREHAWHKQVVDQLRAVVDLLKHHSQSAEAGNGLLAMVVDLQPRLLHRVERLRREHADLLSQSQALCHQLEHLGPNELPSYREIRQRTTWLLNALRHHRASTADLIFEAFETDIGGGD